MSGQKSLQLSLLGELEVARGDELQTLPQSKKTRALLAYLAAVGRPQRRERLCSLLWDIPDDPRGSLRWSLSKLRGLVDDPERKRIVADRDSVRFDNGDTEIDLHRLRSVVAKGLDNASSGQLEALTEVFRGEFLEGLDLPNCPDFQAWCVAEREEARALNLDILRKLLKAYASEPEKALPHGRRLLQLDPYDESARVRLIDHLAIVGRWDEAEQLYDAGAKVLKQLGGDHGTALERAWRVLRANPPAKIPVSPAPIRQPSTPAVAPPAQAHGETAQTPPPRLALPDKPSIAILPLSQPSSGKSDESHFCYGVSEDLAAAVASARWCFVIAPSSLWQYQGKTVDAGDTARDLGVRYIASGNLEKSKDSVRVSLQVIDCEVGGTVLSETFEAPPARLADLLGEISGAIAGAIKSEFDDAAVGRARPRSFSNLSAWDLCKQARMLILERTDESIGKAIKLLDKSIKLDPEFSHAYSLSVAARFDQITLDLVQPETAWTEAVIELAERAVELDQKDALAHSAVGKSRIVRREHQLAIPALETAVGLNPSLSDGHYALGTAFLCSGRVVDAVTHIQRAIRLSPHDPNMGFFLLRMAEAQLLLREYDRAIDWGRQAMDLGPAQWTHYSALLSALGHLDRIDEARALLGEIGNRWPDYTLAFVRDRHLFTDQIRLDFVGETQLFTDQDGFAHYLDGLRKSGVSAQA